ncbi:MAG: 30S ribosomal protein S20 [Planctomycetota bacterium]|jgi:small subunit ribosomal protein S20|nr:30S ribosomal protein S20 [Planctomycetota bacterium]|tara:strand:- start:6 stop:251 length:246 start_codon:yes stop_codon:yes gene_type:complete
MPNSKQSTKCVKRDEVRRIQNKSTTTAMKTAIRHVLSAETPEAAKEALPMAMKRVDKAAKKNLIHANAAARVKSQLSRATN